MKVRLMIRIVFLVMAFSDCTLYSQKPMPSSNPPNSTSRESQQVPQPGKQIEASFKTSDGTEVLYLLYLPQNFRPSRKAKSDSNADLESRKTFALLYFLHGRGESYGPLNRVAKWGPPIMVALGEHLPYIIVSPQCPADDWWAKPKQQTRLTELLDHILESYPIDEEKIFLTGLSMGGYGSWALAASQPKRFAAVVPICGGGNSSDAKN
jgi:predicted peptidase